MVELEQKCIHCDTELTAQEVHYYINTCENCEEAFHEQLHRELDQDPERICRNCKHSVESLHPQGDILMMHCGNQASIEIGPHDYCSAFEKKDEL